MVAKGGEGENPLRLRFPPGPHLRSSRFSRHPRFHQAPTNRFAKNRTLRGLGFLWPGWAGPQALGPKPPPEGDLAHLKTLGCHHSPLGAVGWFPKEELYRARGGVPVFAPALQPLGRAPSPENLANKPLSPASRQPSRVKNSKNAPVLLLISSAESLQPSLTFLLRRNNNAVDRLTTQTSGP